MVKVGLVGLGAEKIEVPDLEVGPEVAQVVGTVWGRDQGHEVLLGDEVGVLRHELLRRSPQGGDGVGQLQDGDHEAVLELILLRQVWGRFWLTCGGCGGRVSRHVGFGFIVANLYSCLPGTRMKVFS